MMSANPRPVDQATPSHDAASRVSLLPVAAKRTPDRHQYTAGMKNVAYLVGVVRDVSRSHFYLQMTNNENLRLPVYFPSNGARPSWFREGQFAKVIGRIVGDGKDDNGRRRFIVVALQYDRPNVLELPNFDAWRKQVPAQSTEDKVFKPFGSGYRPTSVCNQVKIAGFAHAMEVREPMIDEESGKETSARLVITLRQHADPDSMFDVTYYGHLAPFVASKIKRGQAYYFEGRYRVRLHETGDKRESDGRPIVIQEPYIHVEPPQAPTVEDIMFLNDPARVPKWVREMVESSRARSTVGNGDVRPRRDAAGQAASAAPEGPEGPAAAAPASSDVTQAERDAVRNLLG